MIHYYILFYSILGLTLSVILTGIIQNTNSLDNIYGFSQHIAGLTPNTATRIMNVFRTSEAVLKGSIRHNCNGGETSFNYDASDGKRYVYWVGYAPWTKGPDCGTTSRENVVASVLAFASKEVSLEDAIAFCVSMTHEDAWQADVRIKRWEEADFYGQSSWDIPCDNFNSMNL